MKKRITTLLLTLVLSIAFLPAYAFAEGETGADSNWYQAEYHGKPLAVSVDEDGKAVPHGMTLDDPADENEKKWRAEAQSFFG